ncbi:hypothetical protein KAI46_01080 [bacterium]|nr:hypothetical protein [bacterium]
MGRLITSVGLLAVLFLIMGLPLAVSAAGNSLSSDTTILEYSCTDCHDLDVVTEKKFYMAEWQKIVERMVAYDSSEISQTNKLKVLKYIKINLAVDGPGGKARQEHKATK